MLTEKEATQQFKTIVPQKYFHIHSQCKGEANYVKKLKKIFAAWDGRNIPNSGVVDFILEPTEELINNGWEIGCLGVEIKSSYAIENKPGRAIVQILDYQSCSYNLSNGTTELSMIFLYPYRRTGGYIASIMQQEGLGFVRYMPRYDKQFQLLQANTSNEPVFTYFANGEVEIRRPRYGKKFGHR